MEEKATRIHSTTLKKQAAVIGIPFTQNKSNRSAVARKFDSRTHQTQSEMSDTSGNPLKKYSRVIDMMYMHQHNMINKGTDVKEEGQQCNFDEFTQGMCTTVNMSTPEIPPINDASSITDQNEIKNSSAINDTTYFGKTFYQRSQTAASQYLTQARNLQKHSKKNNQSRASQRTNVNTTAVTTSGDMSRVKMTRSMYKHQQDLELQKVGIPTNTRPISKQSGMMGIVLLKTQAKSVSRNHNINNNQQEFRYQTQKQLENNSTYTMNNNLMQSLKKNKEKGYISFQTNVDNSQAIIPMILSNEDLLRTAGEEYPNGLIKNPEDIKKTILSRQYKTNIQNSRQQQHIFEASQAYGRSAPQMQSRIQQQMYINEQASSEEYSYQLSKRNLDLYPHPANIKDPKAVLSRNYYKSHNTSRTGGYRTVGNFKENLNKSNFSGAQQVKNFGFEVIPDYKYLKEQQIKDKHIKQVFKSGSHQGRNQSNQHASYAVVSASALLMNKTAQHFPSQQPPLFLASTKKTPGLQKECAGSYVNVINSRTCLGQQNVFKFSMDLPLRLKQQMWKQHKEDKLILQESSPNKDNNIADERASNKSDPEQHQMQQSRLQLGLEVIGTSSRLQEHITPTNQYKQQNTNTHGPFNQSSSASQLPFPNRQQWSPTSLTHNQIQNPQTAEISKKDLHYLDQTLHSEISPYMNQASAKRYQQGDHHQMMEVVSPAKKTIQSEPYLLKQDNQSPAQHYMDASEMIVKPLRPSQLKLNTNDSNIYSQAMSSENPSHRDLASYQQQPHQINDTALGKKSKIIYSINKSVHNKGSNVNRSKVGGLDIIINGGPAQLRRSLESRGSRDKKHIHISSNNINRSTISSKNNNKNDSSQVMLQAFPMAESAAISSVVASQDHLLPRTSMNQQQIQQQQPSLKATSPTFKHHQIKKQLKEPSFADKSPDLKHLSKHPVAPPQLQQQSTGRNINVESAEMPVHRSQNTSFKRPRKVASAIRRGEGKNSGGGAIEELMITGSEVQHARNESQKLKLASIEFDPEREFERLHDFNITQISIKVDSKRNTLDLSSQLRLQQVVKHTKQPHTTVGGGGSLHENKSIASQPSTTQHQKPQSFKKHSSKKDQSSMRVINNEYLQIKSLSVHERNMSQQEVLQIVKERLLQSPRQIPNRYAGIRAKQNEAKTSQLRARIRSAAPNTKGMFVRAMTLVAPVEEPLAKVTPKDASNIGKKESQEGNSIFIHDSQRVSECDLSQVEATRIQLIKHDVLPHTMSQEADSLITKLPLLKTDTFMVIKENDRQQSPGSPMVFEKQQKSVTEDDLMKKSTITIGDEDIGFFHKNEEGQDRMASQENGQTAQEEHDRYHVQAAIMEKVVVKSPGRQTTEHVVSSFNPDPQYQAVSSFQLPLLPNGNHHHRRNSSAGGKKGSLTQSRRRSFVSNNKDMEDIVGELSPGHSSSAKRTVLIRKSKGQTDISDIIVGSANKESTMKAIDKMSNGGNKSSTRGPVRINNQYGTSLHPNQFVPFEDIDKNVFIGQDGKQGSTGLVNLIKKGNQLPRHGNAAPSVVRRNKETMNRKKADKDKSFNTFYSQNPLSQGSLSNNTIYNGNSRVQTAFQQQSMMAATFHVMPVSASKSQPPRIGAPSNVYQHTNQMQALVIHQSELAIDSQQQKMQMRLIQAYHQHQRQMEEAPILLQNERVVSSTVQPPQVMFPQAVMQSAGLQDSVDTTQIIPQNKITEVNSSKDRLSKTNHESASNPLLVRDSASLASVKGEVILTGRGINIKSNKSTRFSNNAALSKQRLLPNNDLQQSPDKDESHLSVVGTNLKNGIATNKQLRKSQSGNILNQQ